MELPAPTQPYEVRCHRCNCSFAPGTRRCVHCGDKLGSALEVPYARSAAARGPSEEEGEPQAPSLARALLWLLSIGVAIGLSALQTCSR
jgi:hypothetical protein